MADEAGQDSGELIGSSLRGARRSAPRRITQEALAERARVSKSMIVQIEGGQRLPSQRMAARLAQALIELGAEEARVVAFQYRAGGVTPPSDQPPADSQHNPAPEADVDVQRENASASEASSKRLGPTEIAFHKLPTGQRALLMSSEVPFAALIPLLDMFSDNVRPPEDASLEDVVRITQTAAGNRALVFPAHTPLDVFVRIVERAYRMLNHIPSVGSEPTTEADQGRSEGPTHTADGQDSSDA